MSPSHSLTTTGFANIRHSLRADEFTFIIGAKHHRVTCSSMVSCFLSPAVRNIIQADLTARTFDIGPNLNVELFEQFVKIGDGHHLSAKMVNDNAEELRRSAQLLENTEFATVILVTLCLIAKSPTLPITAITDETQVELLAQNFYQFTQQNSNFINVFDFNTLLAIISYQSLEIEEFLGDFILSRIQQDPIHFQLLRFLNFPVLSTDRFKRIWDLGPGVIQHGPVDFDLWTQIGTRMILPLDKLSLPLFPFERYYVNFPYRGVDATRMENGIIRFLSDRCGGNVVDQGIVQTFQSTGDCRSIADIGQLFR
jgi:hypothetical protein